MKNKNYICIALSYELNLNIEKPDTVASRSPVFFIPKLFV